MQQDMNKEHENNYYSHQGCFNITLVEQGAIQHQNPYNRFRYYILSLCLLNMLLY